MPNIGYQNRRYKVVMGKLEKSWKNPPPAGWYVKKSDAWAAYQEEIAEAKVFDDALAAKKALRATQTPPDPNPEVSEPGDPEPAGTAEPPETESTAEPPEPEDDL